MFMSFDGMKGKGGRDFVIYTKGRQRDVTREVTVKSSRSVFRVCRA